MEIRDSDEAQLLNEFIQKINKRRDEVAARFRTQMGAFEFPSTSQAVPVVDTSALDTSALEDAPPMTLEQAVADDAKLEPKAEVKVPSDVEIMQLMTAAQQRGVGIPRITELRGPVRVTQMTPEQRIEFVAKLAKEGR